MDTAAMLNSAAAATETVKMEQDFSGECDEKIPKAKELAASGQLTKAIEDLIALEKQTRVNGDMLSTGRVLTTIVQLCFEAKNYSLLNENVNLLAKRRGQLKGAVQKMVQECCTYIDELPTKELKYQLIDTLRNVTEGKIYVEVERARLTYKLAKMREEEGDVKLAGSILQELQVETYGSMEKREKVELILEQMRYCLANEDYIRTQIISKKISVKFFDGSEGTEDLKMKFYRLMVQLDQHEGNYLNICKHFKQMMTSNQGDSKLDLLKHSVLYLLLSPFDNEQSDLMHRTVAQEEKQLELIPTYRSLLDLFLNQELINWKDLCALYEAELRKGDVFGPSTDAGAEKRWSVFRQRVVEHNIRIMAKYYTTVRMERIAQLLELKSEEVEKTICNMITSHVISGKIDRPSGIVTFSGYSKDPSESLNEWAGSLGKLMGLISKATHLINKEQMVHRHLHQQLQPMEID